MEFDIEKAFVQLRAARKNCVDPDRFFLRREDTALMNRIVVLIKEADPESAEKIHLIVAGPLVPMDQVAEKMTAEVKLGESDYKQLTTFDLPRVDQHPNMPPIAFGITGWNKQTINFVEYWCPEFPPYHSQAVDALDGRIPEGQLQARHQSVDALEEACREHGVLSESTAPESFSDLMDGIVKEHGSTLAALGDE